MASLHPPPEAAQGKTRQEPQYSGLRILNFFSCLVKYEPDGSISRVYLVASSCVLLLFYPPRAHPRGR